MIPTGSAGIPVHEDGEDVNFIALEGIDGCGKTTQISRIAQRLHPRPVLVTRQPGGSDLGDMIRSVLLGEYRIDDRAEALLFAADRAQHVAHVIRPALDAGTIVLCDRYVDSTLAYQGIGRGLDASELLALCQYATRGLTPDLTVVLDLDVATSWERRQVRGGDDRIEAGTTGRLGQMRALYLDRARTHPGRYAVID